MKTMPKFFLKAATVLTGQRVAHRCVLTLAKLYQQMGDHDRRMFSGALKQMPMTSLVKFEKLPPQDTGWIAELSNK